MTNHLSRFSALLLLVSACAAPQTAVRPEPSPPPPPPGAEVAAAEPAPPEPAPPADPSIRWSPKEELLAREGDGRVAGRIVEIGSTYVVIAPYEAGQFNRFEYRGKAPVFRRGGAPASPTEVTPGTDVIVTFERGESLEVLPRTLGIRILEPAQAEALGVGRS